MVDQTGNWPPQTKPKMWLLAECCPFCLTACGDILALQKMLSRGWLTSYLLKGRSVHPSSQCRVAPVMELCLCLSLQQLICFTIRFLVACKIHWGAEMIKFCNNPALLQFYRWSHKPALAPAFYEFIRVSNASRSEVRTKYFQLLLPLHVEI